MTEESRSSFKKENGGRSDGMENSSMLKFRSVKCEDGE